MSSSGKGAGAAPNYSGAAGQDAANSQANTSAQTAQNRPNQTNQFGTTSTWGVDANGNPTQMSQFGGQVGQAAGMLQGQMTDALGKPLGTGDDARKAATDASYAYSKSRLDPRFAQQKSQMDADLANSGAGQAAQDTAHGNFNRDQNDAYMGAEANAQQLGTNAQQVTFNQNLQSREAPMNELGAFGQMFGGQSGFNAAGRADTSNYLQALGLQGNYNLQNADQQNQAWGGLAQGVLGAAGKALTPAAAASDERVKDDIHRHSEQEVLPGVPLATFRYKGSKKKMAGVIAQDVEKAGHGHMVKQGKDGIKRVHPSLKPFAL